jgi:protein-arginine kinase activator protein McsA
MCGQVEGQIKLTRLRDGHRSIIYICEKCANRR